MQLEKKRWEHDKEDYDKLVKELKEELKKTKAEAEAAKTQQSGGIQIDKSQQDIVKKIADELLACKIKTDALQTDNAKLESGYERMRGQLEDTKVKVSDIKIDENQATVTKKVTDELLTCKMEVDQLKEKNSKFEKEYKEKTLQMRDKLGNELVGEHQQEDFEKQVKKLKEELKKTKAEAKTVIAQQSDGIRIDKSQEGIVKKIADELMACKIKTDALQTDNAKLESEYERMRGQLEDTKVKVSDIKTDENQAAVMKKVTDELLMCKMKVDQLKEETLQMRDKMGNEPVAHQQEDYEKQVKELKEELKKTKVAAEAAKTQQSGGIQIDKSQQDIVKKIADELLACKIKTDALQTDNTKLESEYERMRGQLEDTKVKVSDIKIDENQAAVTKKITDELLTCKTEIDQLKEENSKFEKTYKEKTLEMRHKLGNELVAYKINMSRLRAEKENLEMDKESLYEQIKTCDARIAEVEESKEKLQMDKDSLYAQVKGCKDIKNKYQDYESKMIQLQKKAATAEAELQNCQTKMKTKEEEVCIQ